MDYEIPDRIKDGYGINQSIIEAAHRDGVDTLLTCDNGIAAVEEIRRAKELGMTVIVTDHHEVLKIDGAEIKPPADAVVDPKQEDCPYPNPEICGAVVAWKLVSLLYQRCGIPREEWLDMLELAAVATVGECDAPAGREPDHRARGPEKNRLHPQPGPAQPGGHEQSGSAPHHRLPHRLCHRPLLKRRGAAADGQDGPGPASVPDGGGGGPAGAGAEGG